jgi:hypothetical protein
MKYSNKNEWLEATQEAATGMIAGDAWRMVRTWQEWTGQSIELPAQEQYLEYIRQNLLLTAFAVATDSHMQYVLQNLTSQFLLDSEYQLTAIQKIEDRISAAGEGF